MNSILVYIFIAATALSASVTFGQGNDYKNNANIFTVTSASVHTRRRVPRASDSVLRSINSRLTPHQGFMRWSDISYDLQPAAQSYFYEPETPSTTTVRPTFKRRKTLRPISSFSDQKKKSPVNFDGGFADNPESPNQAPFNPFRQIVNTGFAKKRPSPQPSLRSKIRATQLDNPDQNINEINEVITTTEGQEPTPTEITPSTVATGYDNKPFSRSHLPQQGAGRRKKIQPTPAPQVKIDRPNRFASSRRKTSVAPPASKISETQTEASHASSSTLSTNSRSSNRGGRQGFILRPKAPTAHSPTENETEASKPRRRKKPTTESSAASFDIPSTTLETFRLPNPFEEQAQSNDVPTARKAPSSPSEVSHRRNPGLSRRPGPGFKSKQLPPSDVAGNGQISHTSEYTLDGQNQVAVDKPVNMRMRIRRPGRAGAPVIDSVHESSDSVAAVVVPAVPAEEQHDDAVVISSNSETPAEPTETENYKPRMLTNRRPNPLDKLTNRQAAARRFLTPKKAEQSTTAAPVTPAPGTKAVRKPFSLQNLRNRRVGPLGASSTTTEAPQEASAAPAEEGADAVVPQPDASGNNKTEDFNAEPKPDAGTPGNETAVVDPAETQNEPEVPAPTGLLGRKRPLLPGNRKPLMNRVPSLKSKVTVTTTAKPTNEETTTAPTCEEGKRYNKILRKCIPSYNPRSG